MTVTRDRAAEQTDPGVVLRHDPALGFTYTWHDQSTADKDTCDLRVGAWATSVLIVTDPTGRCAGYLRLTWTDPATVAAVFDRPLSWADEHDGWSLGYQTVDGQRVPPPAADLWVRAHRHARTVPVSMRDTPGAPEVAPSDPAVLEADLRALERKIRRRMRAWTVFYAVPYVEFSRTEDGTDGTPDARGKGVGREMYVLAARRLATTGRVLAASGIRTSSALALWTRLEADPAVPTASLERTGPRDARNVTTTVLDYRSS